MWIEQEKSSCKWSVQETLFLVEMPWLNVELTDESCKMQVKYDEKESYVHAIDKAHGNVLEDIVETLEGEFVESEIRDIIHFLMPTQMKNLSFLDALGKARIPLTFSYRSPWVNL